MKKKFAIMLCACLTVCSAAGCGAQGQKTEEKPAATEAVQEALPEEPAEPIQANETADLEEEVTEEPLEDLTEEEEPEAEPIAYPELPLPEYHYYGPEDWADYADSITMFLAENSFGEESADLTTCTPVILKVDDSDPSDVKAWGEFWLDQFMLVNTTLISTAGGSNIGVAHFDTTGGSPVLTNFEVVDDGADYFTSLEKLFGPEDLVDAVTEVSTDIDPYRLQALSYYINQNMLYITQIQDYGWAPKPIPNAPETSDEAQIFYHVSNLGYTTEFDMRNLCVMESDEGDVISTVNSDDWNNVSIYITSRTDDLESIISEVNSNPAEFEDWKEMERNDDVTFGEKDGCIFLNTPGPYEDGQRIIVCYLVPRDSDTLVVEVRSDYSADEEKQMYTDSIVEGVLGHFVVK